jgi:hypothetical protein
MALGKEWAACGINTHKAHIVQPIGRIEFKFYEKKFLEKSWSMSGAGT